MTNCPKCLGVGTLMVSISPTKKGFKYETCDICEGKGVVLPELHQSFVDSLKTFEDSDVLD